MKSIRLNKQSRKHILNSVMAKYDEVNPAPDSESVDSIYEQFALKLYNEKYKHLLEYFKQIPKNMMNTRGYIAIQLQNENIHHPNFPDDMRLPNEGVVIPLSVAQSDEYIAIQKLDIDQRREEEAYNKQRYAYLEQVETVINSCNTTGQLVELWPEVTEFIPETMRNPSKINLPSVCINNLNQALTK